MNKANIHRFYSPAIAKKLDGTKITALADLSPNKEHATFSDPHQPEFANIACSGVLNDVAAVEKETTNLFPDPNDFTTWSKVGTGTGIAPVVTADQSTGIIEGQQLSGDRAVFDLNGGETSADRSILRRSATGVDDGESYTMFFWMKSNTPQSYSMRLHRGGSDFQTVVVTPELQKFKGTFTTTASELCGLELRGNNSDGFADVLIFWGQVEAGPYETLIVEGSRTAPNVILSDFTPTDAVGSITTFVDMARDVDEVAVYIYDSTSPRNYLINLLTNDRLRVVFGSTDLTGTDSVVVDWQPNNEHKTWLFYIQRNGLGNPVIAYRADTEGSAEKITEATPAGVSDDATVNSLHIGASDSFNRQTSNRFIEQISDSEVRTHDQIIDHLSAILKRYGYSEIIDYTDLT